MAFTFSAPSSQLEKKEKLIQEKAESNAQLTQNLQRCQKELDARISEINRKDMEVRDKELSLAKVCSGWSLIMHKNQPFVVFECSLL